MKICLVGFMGCGKSTLGQQLADRLNLEFIDLDSTFEEKYHMQITSFFEWFGEAKFREFETQLLAEVLEKDNYILSTGGGTPCFFDNMKNIKEKTFSIYIKVSPEILTQRLNHTKKKRPIIQNFKKDDLLSFIKNIIPEREKYYLQADLICESDNANISETSNLIQQQLRSIKL
ncbi:MAG: shikimate kinase [Bacteroidota bacterium]